MRVQAGIKWSRSRFVPGGAARTSKLGSSQPLTLIRPLRGHLLPSLGEGRVVAAPGAHLKSNPRPQNLSYTPLRRSSPRVCGAPEASREGRAVRGRLAFWTNLTRSAPKLRPTGTRTGLRLVVRLKPVWRRPSAHQAGGEQEDRGRNSRAGRFVVPASSIRGSPTRRTAQRCREAPRTPSSEGRLEWDTNLGPKKPRGDCVRRDAGDLERPSGLLVVAGLPFR